MLHRGMGLRCWACGRTAWAIQAWCVPHGCCAGVRADQQIFTDAHKVHPYTCFCPVVRWLKVQCMDPHCIGLRCSCALPCCSGDVVTEDTYQKCIKPDGEFKGKRVGPKDIIRLQNGGTGFAARDGEKAQVKKHFALGEWGGTGRTTGYWACGKLFRVHVLV